MAALHITSAIKWPQLLFFCVYHITDATERSNNLRLLRLCLSMVHVDLKYIHGDLDDVFLLKYYDEIRVY